MFTVMRNLTNNAKKNFHFFATFIAVLLMVAVSGVSMATDKAEAPASHHIKDYVVTVDPRSAKLIGPEIVKQITDFFDYADNAIMTKNVEALSFLYSERYVDGDHKKADVIQAWKRLFGEFDDFRMTHNLRFITTDPKSNVMIVQCSGILMGEPKTDKHLIALDHWMNINHVLVKEDKGWKIIGTAGTEEKRFWFDKPMHPLF